MTRQFTDDAKNNLQKGIKKMENAMSAAAQVRRSFRLGRPPKPGEALPLHPAVVWDRANAALANLRARMVAAGLDPSDAVGTIIYVDGQFPTTPRRFPLELPGVSTEQAQAALFGYLGNGHLTAIGMVFRQFDQDTKQQSTFPYQFTGPE